MEITDKEVQDLIAEYEAYAKTKGFKLNPNRKIVENIVRALLKKEKEYGARYCPCRVMTGDPEQDQKTICPCIFKERELRDQGFCHCSLFVRDE